MTLTKKITLRDSASPTTSVDLFLIRRYQARPNTVYNNTEFILNDGSRAIDYGTDKKVWTWEIEIEAGKTENFTAANLTDLETLYALRTTQTIQLVDNWNESGQVYTVHFEKFKEISHDPCGTDRYIFELKEA